MIIDLSYLDLSLAAVLILLLALYSHYLRLGLEKRILFAALRTALQLSLVGIVLKVIFEKANVGWIALMALVMLLAAGREVRARQKRPLKGWWGFGVGTIAMFLSSFTVTVLCLTVIIQGQPWYLPQYAIPLLGMLLGNTMTGISLSVDQLEQAFVQQREVIEQRLMLGQDRREALGEIKRDCIRSGMIPIVNSMAAAGLVSLPGMMTGQILAGNPPMIAVKYQILIMFLIAAGTGFGVLIAVLLTSRRIFDDRHRLRLDRLSKGS